MSIFDVFSSKPGTTAATQAYKAQTQGYGKGQQQAVGALKQGTRQGVQELEQGRRQGLQALQQGTGQAAGYLNQALPTWQNLQNIGNQGLQQYGNLVGLGGADMQGTLQNIPGYQFALNQGLDALNRQANARGMLQSGNQSQDIIDYSQGKANENYFNYLNALNPYFGLSQNAAQGQTGVLGGLANLYGQQGQQAAGINTGTASELAGLRSGLGSNIANIDWQAALGRGQAGADLAQNRYAASQGANQNLWNAILGLAGGVTSAAGNAGGFGTLFR